MHKVFQKLFLNGLQGCCFFFLIHNHMVIESNPGLVMQKVWKLLYSVSQYQHMNQVKFRDHSEAETTINQVHVLSNNESVIGCIREPTTRQPSKRQWFCRLPKINKLHLFFSSLVFYYWPCHYWSHEAVPAALSGCMKVGGVSQPGFKSIEEILTKDKKDNSTVIQQHDEWTSNHSYNGRRVSSVFF